MTLCIYIESYSGSSVLSVEETDGGRDGSTSSVFYVILLYTNLPSYLSGNVFPVGNRGVSALFTALPLYTHTADE